MLEHELIKVQQPKNEQLIYVEFGAGKAGLSSFVGMKLGELHDEAEGSVKEGKQFLVVDM